MREMVFEECMRKMRQRRRELLSYGPSRASRTRPRDEEERALLLLLDSKRMERKVRYLGENTYELRMD
jgi:hypothetical protein